MWVFNLKSCANWEAIRTHLCTLAVAVSLNSTWRVPRDAYRYGGVSYLLALTLVMVVVALPTTLLQLTIGQLSQHDAVGIWRAVPFFKGVGYLRLLISYIASIYSMIYVALTALIYLLFIVNNSIPFWECSESAFTPEGENDESKEITCMNSTFLAPIGDQPEYYLALSMLTIVLWIIFPFITPTRSMRYHPPLAVKNASSKYRQNSFLTRASLRSVLLNCYLTLPIHISFCLTIKLTSVTYLACFFPNAKFYNTIKLMKRILYALGPLVLMFMIVVVSCIGSRNNLTNLQRQDDWRHYLESKIWLSAVIQALLSSQIAGGFLISSGAAIYSSANVQRTSWLIVGANVVCSWLGAVFWFSVAGEVRDASALTVLVQMYVAAEEHNLDVVWPLLVYALLFFSGIVSMLVLLYPLYDCFRRAGGQGWRLISFTSSFFGAAAALAVLIGGLPALSVLEDTAVPLLICIATVLEVVAFIFIYGWKPLVGDVEFLSGRALVKWWVWGWFAGPAVVLTITVWWLVALFLENENWMEAPWHAITIVTTASIAVTVFLALAVTSVAKQVQFDLIGKIKSSFEPSRHWGPRDPITYYYWLAQRQQNQIGERDSLTPRYSERQLGQLTGAGIFHISRQVKEPEESI